ncbi:2-C-methyl-D-erythritol 4-phosphate cytidylyltransferase [Clostridium gasigenes]|uniref:2-C-methyl-D-erythritol 4-phosphate cytidylyltransferase n=1 Tax=Clostridium gasigenes TaxID=94869 RepID=A0A1H0SIF5_9CLOT|nr:2-C-methyl-D-erythritol 4-phosphate cytidylyltransferase [Clostridium gasigenes]MBU3088951.1 2-C-methyl-D-erythritol 4-phosphate cytidylyltransferase [Clostridium gasigenes]MBU3104890.1 2-C-methyl-D-erythritol 4-phosphate cytidylyltransferase [Clostridium gasigenes]MBU3108682.1 2-C-methyl-D-erythritol 4-phosphate cytidylyltransferase [Clostridium gasigenes]MBU3133447.1 2-C-methyl-D-erythritol 4-phosphate cytidylyltransferase [Clostridium gasigenes]NKF07704.1 2-C-methyl-D-erythritol 4-phosph
MVSAIILAGGRGKRMGSEISKQYIEIKGKPILYYTLKKFIDCKSIDSITLVLPEDEIEYCRREILVRYSLNIDNIVAGGKERQDSVCNGLESMINTNIVLIHDGARPFVSNKIIEQGIKFAKLYGAAAPGVTPKDTIKIKNKESFSVDTPNRENLVAIQTPQVFDFNTILECHKKIKKDNVVVTDDTMVVELYGNKVYLYDGDYTNIKVTTPEDLILAERLV